MTAEDTRRAMHRYFSVLGSDRFSEAVDEGVTWTVTDTGRVITGVQQVRHHLDALHASMVDTKKRDLVLTDDIAFLEGDCSVQEGPAERVAFCIAYEVRYGRVSAMRLYGRLETAAAMTERRAQQVGSSRHEPR
jgi:hypothetical protein